MITPASFRISARATPNPASRSGIVAPASLTPDPLGHFSNFLCSALLNHAFVADTAYVPPTALWVGLYRGDNTEVSGDPNYSRLTVAFSAAAGDPASIQNTAAIQWPVATVDWGIIYWAGLHDAATGGVSGLYGALAGGALLTPDGSAAATKAVTAGDVFEIDAGAFVLTLG